MTSKYMNIGKCVAIYDAADEAIVMAHRWHISRPNGKPYVATKIMGKRVTLHRMLLPNAKEIDHANGDGLDNRRENLRACTHAQNQQNRSKFKNNRSGYCGVYFDGYTRNKRKNNPRIKPWVAQIVAYGKRHRLGYFKKPEEAAEAYDRAALLYHGEFARLNFS